MLVYDDTVVSPPAAPLEDGPLTVIISERSGAPDPALDVVAKREPGFGVIVADPLGGKAFLTASELLALSYMCGLPIDRDMVRARYPLTIDKLDAIRAAGRPE